MSNGMKLPNGHRSHVRRTKQPTKIYKILPIPLARGDRLCTPLPLAIYCDSLRLLGHLDCMLHRSKTEEDRKHPPL